MIPLASLAAKTLGKRISKVTTEAQIKSGELNKHLMEIIKNHKLIKIFQRENFEVERTDTFLTNLKDKAKKIAIVFVRASPIMEILTGIMIALLIFYSGKLIMSDELEINNFFSFLAAMMLAYQPVRSLATLNLSISSGLSSAKRIIPIIDTKNEIIENEILISTVLTKFVRLWSLNPSMMRSMPGWTLRVCRTPSVKPPCSLRESLACIACHADSTAIKLGITANNIGNGNKTTNQFFSEICSGKNIPSMAVNANTSPTIERQYLNIQFLAILPKNFLRPSKCIHCTLVFSNGSSIRSNPCP